VLAASLVVLIAIETHSYGAARERLRRAAHGAPAHAD